MGVEQLRTEFVKFPSDNASHQVSAQRTARVAYPNNQVVCATRDSTKVEIDEGRLDLPG